MGGPLRKCRGSTETAAAGAPVSNGPPVYARQPAPGAPFLASLASLDCRRRPWRRAPRRRPSLASPAPFHPARRLGPGNPNSGPWPARPRRPPSKAGLTAAPHRPTLAGMTPYETASLAVADIALYIAGAAAFAAFVSAMTSPLVVWLMRKGIKEMVKANTDRAAQAAEDRKATQAQMAQAAEDRKAIQAQTAQAAAQAAEDRKAIQAQMAQAAEDRKAVQAQMAQAAAQAAEDRKAIQAQMAQAAEDRKAVQAQMAQAAAQAAEDRKAIQAQMAQAAEDRKVTQGMLAALTELVRRTSSPSSQAGSQPGPAE